MAREGLGSRVRGPTVTFHGGVREIGGNKILIEDGPDKVLFDFGPSFDPRFEQYYVDYLQPRSTSPIRDLLEFDLIPWIPGLYSREALAGIEERYTPPEVHGVFVSHAHFDHAGYLEYLDPEIPVYVGEGTRTILEAIETSSTMAKYGEHPWSTFPPGKPIRVGRIEVVPLPVDHSVPHAFGFLVRTSEGTLVYTGDFRQHGPRADLTRAFLEAAHEEAPEALLIEGTRAGPDPRRNFSEAGVRSGVEKLLAGTEGLALVACYPRDLDRIGTLYGAAVKAGRDLVVPFRTAHLLATLEKDRSLKVPVPGAAPNLKVYRRPKKRYYTWEQRFLGDAVDAEWVRRHGKDALLLLDMNQFPELIDIRPEEGTPFVRSMSEPFSEEDGNEAVLRNWLDHFGLRLHQFHASGHCSGPELDAFARGVGPKAIYPIHTEHPEAFDASAARVISPTKGTSYRVASGAHGS
jgi:ribonuclease J